MFPWEPFRLSRCTKVHCTTSYHQTQTDLGKLPDNFQISQRMAIDTEEFARRSTIYFSLVDSMVASVLFQLSPRDERTKLLKEKLAIIQEAQVATMTSGFAAASSLQLLRRDTLLQNFSFQPQVLSIVGTAPFEGSHVPGSGRNYSNVYAVSDTQTGCQDHQVTFQKATKEATSSQGT